MSRHKPIQIKRGAKMQKQLKSSNVFLIKLIDPIVQCLVFVYFLYCLDAEANGPSYRAVLLFLIGWQTVSALFNLFLNDPKLLKGQRLAYLIVNVCYMAAFFFIESHFSEKDFGINETDIPFLHRNQTLLMGGAIIIAFWYNVTCYREIKGLLAGANRDNYN